jgi:DNA-binding NarL/FixJ family response regulator
VTIRLLSVDDHPVIKLGLEALLGQHDDLELVAHCAESKKALEFTREYRPDIVILDINMPGDDGLTIARDILAEQTPPRIIIYAAEIQEKQMIDGLRIGVQGFLLKEMSPDLLLLCIRKVYAGEKWIEKHSARETLENMLRREAGARSLAGLITKRESAILGMVINGAHNKEIAGALFISEGTVKVHLHNIYEKLGVDSRVGLLRYAQSHGLI